MKFSLIVLMLCGALLMAGGCADNIDNLVMCDADEDCPGGYCHDTDGFCVSGQRECLVDTDCTPPTTICGNGQCVEGCGLGGCDVGEQCNATTGRCRFLESCTIDSQCDPPDRVCIAEFCEPGCGITGCSDGFCDPYSGHCQGSTSCSGDGECAPPASICEGETCVPGCTITGCTGADECNQITGRCVPVGGCGGDQDCNPPSTICEGTACVLGCTPTSCGAGQQCTTTTGRCESTTQLADGEDCTGGSQCLSGFCMHVEVYHNPTWVEFDVCSRECCAENDCGLGFACMYHHGVKMCIPDDIYPPGFTFTQAAGQVCGANGPYCRSGFCNPAFNTCSRTCCNSGHCAGDACVWYDDTASGVMFELCGDITGLPSTHTGAFCSGPMDCQSFICITNQCADMCCTNGDCPGGYRCAQVLGQSTTPVATSACVPGNPGTGADGAACAVGASPSPQCQSGLCAGGTCRSPCCSDAECGGGTTCRPVLSGFDIGSNGTPDFVRACVP